MCGYDVCVFLSGSTHASFCVNTAVLSLSTGLYSYSSVPKMYAYSTGQVDMLDLPRVCVCVCVRVLPHKMMLSNTFLSKLTVIAGCLIQQCTPCVILQVKERMSGKGKAVHVNELHLADLLPELSPHRLTERRALAQRKKREQQRAKVLRGGRTQEGRRKKGGKGWKGKKRWGRRKTKPRAGRKQGKRTCYGRAFCNGGGAFAKDIEVHSAATDGVSITLHLRHVGTPRPPVSDEELRRQWKQRCVDPLVQEEELDRYRRKRVTAPGEGSGRGKRGKGGMGMFSSSSAREERAASNSHEGKTVVEEKSGCLFKNWPEEGTHLPPPVIAAGKGHTLNCSMNDIVLFGACHFIDEVDLHDMSWHRR